MDHKYADDKCYDDSVGMDSAKFESIMDEVRESVHGKKTSRKKKNQYTEVVNGIEYRKFYGKYCENVFWIKGDCYMYEGKLIEVSEDDCGERVRGNEVCYRPETNCY